MPDHLLDDQPLAPDEVLHLISCGCKGDCKTTLCIYIKSALACTEFCKCRGYVKCESLMKFSQKSDNDYDIRDSISLTSVLNSEFISFILICVQKLQALSGKVYIWIIRSGNPVKMQNLNLDIHLGKVWAIYNLWHSWVSGKEDVASSCNYSNFLCWSFIIFRKVIESMLKCWIWQEEKSLYKHFRLCIVVLTFQWWQSYSGLLDSWT